MNHPDTTRMTIVGPFAVYAGNAAIARQVVKAVLRRRSHPAFGTVRLPTGENVDWVDMRHPALRPQAMRMEGIGGPACRRGR
ncbi:hypothetical protein E4K72_16995 [Oxalobacteraceae bacterium OM1]|nr:hypothetical protein E4K72_16995 [Oxalobacteraceae bacterium OM1]